MPSVNIICIILIAIDTSLMLKYLKWHNIKTNAYSGMWAKGLTLPQLVMSHLPEYKVCKCLKTLN